MQTRAVERRVLVLVKTIKKSTLKTGNKHEIGAFNS